MRNETVCRHVDVPEPMCRCQALLAGHIRHCNRCAHRSSSPDRARKTRASQSANLVKMLELVQGCQTSGSTCLFASFRVWMAALSTGAVCSTAMGLHGAQAPVSEEARYFNRVSVCSGG